MMQPYLGLYANLRSLPFLQSSLTDPYSLSHELIADRHHASFRSTLALPFRLRIRLETTLFLVALIGVTNIGHVKSERPILINRYFYKVHRRIGAWGSVVVKALRY